MRNYYLDKEKTGNLFKILKILTINELYNKMSTIKIHLNKKDFEAFNIHNTKNECNNNLKLLKYNTTLMKNVYIHSGIKYDTQ